MGFVDLNFKFSITAKRRDEYLNLPEDSIINTFTAAVKYSLKPSGKRCFYIRRKVLRMIDP